jgi:hypothetical protein
MVTQLSREDPHDIRMDVSGRQALLPCRITGLDLLPKPRSLQACGHLNADRLDRAFLHEICQAEPKDLLAFEDPGSTMPRIHSDLDPHCSRESRVILDTAEGESHGRLADYARGDRGIDKLEIRVPRNELKG